MRIVYNGTVLADGGNRGSPVGLTVAGTKEVQVAQFLRGALGRVWDRGNKRITLSWQQTRTHASVSAAQIFAATHADDISTGEASASITTTGGTAMQLEAAVLDLPQLVSYAGVKTVHRYSLTGTHISGGSLPAWAAGGGGIQFITTALSGAGEKGFSSLRINGQKIIDQQSLTRGGTPALKDRENKLNIFQWEQARDFATVDEAEQFLLLHGQAVPDGEEDLDLTLDSGAGISLADAVVQIPSGSQPHGLRTLHSYEAIGRAISVG
jgi:hypothetical protein